MSTDWVLGIDFGTSNTAAAHTSPTDGAVQTLPLTHSSNLMRSGVFVEDAQNMAVGDVALNEADRNPAGYLPAPKRLIGQPIIAVNGIQIPPYLPVAAVFHSVLGKAVTAHGNQPPARVALTHPEAWSPDQVQVLIDAAASVGIDPSRITTISEPRAAAHFYTRTHRLTPGSRIAVFDFGGGTLDVAVLTAEALGESAPGAAPVGFRVIAARGDNGIGGKNFDALIRGWVDQQLESRNPDLLSFLRGSAPMSVKQALDESIRRAKELLSESPSATIPVAGGGFHETLQITRDEFEELIRPVVDRGVELTRATLADAGITDPGQINALYLTGGSSRIPLIHSRLREVGPIAVLDDPKTVVAQGALVGLTDSRPSAATSPMPAAADLMPSYNKPPQPETIGSPSTNTASRNRMLIAGAAALIVVLGGAAVIFGLRGGDDDAASTAAATSASATTATTSASTSPDTVDGVMASLPTPLQESAKNCKEIDAVDNVTTAGCVLSGSLVDGQASTVVLTAFVDESTTEKFRTAMIGSQNDPNVTILTSDDAFTTAKISKSTEPGQTGVDVVVVNTQSGLGVNVGMFDNDADAKRFLVASELFSA